MKDDQIDEPDETVGLRLSNAREGASLGEPTDAVLFIQDDDARPSLSISDETVKEGYDGARDVTFVVRLSVASAKTITVEYATRDGSASAPSDYAGRSGTLTFSPGQTQKTVSVQVKGDTLDESNEIFSLVLSDAVNATALGWPRGRHHSRRRVERVHHHGYGHYRLPGRHGLEGRDLRVRG